MNIFKNDRKYERTTPGIKQSGFRGLRAFQPTINFVTVDSGAARNPLHFIPAPLCLILKKKRTKCKN